MRRGKEGDIVSKVLFILCELKSLLSIKPFKNQKASTQIAKLCILKSQHRSATTLLSWSPSTRLAIPSPTRYPSATRTYSTRKENKPTVPSLNLLHIVSLSVPASLHLWKGYPVIVPRSKMNAKLKVPEGKKNLSRRRAQTWNPKTTWKITSSSSAWFVWSANTRQGAITQASDVPN